jgi:hypothetical protein
MHRNRLDRNGLLALRLIAFSGRILVLLIGLLRVRGRRVRRGGMAGESRTSHRQECQRHPRLQGQKTNVHKMLL